MYTSNPSKYIYAQIHWIQLGRVQLGRSAMSEEKWMNKGMMGGKWRGLRSTRGPMLSLLFVMRSGTMIYNGGFSFDMRVILYKSPPAFKNPRSANRGLISLIRCFSIPSPIRQIARQKVQRKTHGFWIYAFKMRTPWYTTDWRDKNKFVMSSRFAILKK